MRQLHTILQKMVATTQAQRSQHGDSANMQADTLSTMLAQSGLSADVLTMLLLKTNENAEATGGPKVSPILNPIKAIKTSLVSQKPTTANEDQEKELT